MQDHRQFTEKVLFADEAERRPMLEVYGEGIANLQNLMKNLRKSQAGQTN